MVRHKSSFLRARFGAASRRKANRTQPAAALIEKLEVRLLLSAVAEPAAPLVSEFMSSETVMAPVTAGPHLITVATGLSDPLFVVSPPGDVNRLFIVEQHSGAVKILNLDSGVINATPFLTVPNVSQGGEQGLLGLAFDPNYAQNGKLYVAYTNAAGNKQLQQYHVSSGNPDVVDSTPPVPILSIAQPQVNHNGGWIGFGRDGFLYVATGDGGGANGAGTGQTAGIGNAQDTNKLLGKILRIDVGGDDFPADPARNYRIPASNPFVGTSAAPEIWAYGLRNPFRPSFDRGTGDLWIADVGQTAREEINFQPAASAGGENYGWRLREGTIATPTGGVGGNKPAGAIDPIYDYTHGTGTNQGNVVTGGYVYRGPIAELQGQYFFADFANNRVWSLQADGSNPAQFNGTNFTNFVDRTTQFTPDSGALEQISSFGEDAVGNLYVVSLAGSIYKLVSDSTAGHSPVYRSYNPNADLHFFTTSLTEYQFTLAVGYRDEAGGDGAFSVLPSQTAGATAIHRLYDSNSGEHYLTLSDGERDFLVQRGWQLEHDEGFMFDQQSPGTVEVFHLYNSATGSHVYTISPQTRDAILQQFPGIWQQHRSLGFAFAQQASTSGSVIAESTALNAESDSATPANRSTSDTQSAGIASAGSVQATSGFDAGGAAESSPAKSNDSSRDVDSVFVEWQLASSLLESSPLESSL